MDHASGRGHHALGGSADGSLAGIPGHAVQIGKSMTPKRIMLNRLLVTAPWLTVLVLLGLSAALPNRTTFTPDSERRKAEVAAALNAVPYFIGRWVGEDREVTREAQQLLRPNAIF